MIFQVLKSIVRRTFIYKVILRSRHGYLYCKLAETGHLVPPPYEVKRLTLLLYARLFGLSTFVETGTYLGDTVDTMKSEFDRIYSIELQPELYNQAVQKFADSDHICLLLGDSGKVLPQILNEIHGPCLFWLDGHYSSGNTAKGDKETPIIEELNHILSHTVENHVILIDDARCFTGYGDYPALDQIKKIILSKRPDYFFDVRYDIIRAHRILR